MFQIYLVFIMIAGIVLAGLSTVSLVKNFLISFNVSDNGWKTALAAILVVICLLCALISYSEAYTIRDIYNVTQPSVGLAQEEINQLKSRIPIKAITLTVSICIGYIAYFVHSRLIKNIRQSKLKEIELNASRRWTRRNDLNN